MSQWEREAINIINADFNRSADTHLVKLNIQSLEGVDIYLKDESTHPTGSLKHRLARSLFLYAICNGWIKSDTPVIEASSGSTAVSEAYFAHILWLRFIAVVPETTSPQKLEKIRAYGGECHLVKGSEIYTEAERLARELNGHYMDQFTYAERATDWQGNNNIARSIFSQMSKERFPVPSWIVMSAGTGGTSATIGRYIRYAGHETKLCLADPENSVFFDAYKTRDRALTHTSPSRIEGIGRPRVEPSFMPDVIDDAMQVKDVDSLAMIHVLEKMIDRKCGGSTGTNLFATLKIAQRMMQEGQTGSLVTLICDSGERYLDSYYNEKWLAERNLDLRPNIAALERFLTKNDCCALRAI